MGRDTALTPTLLALALLLLPALGHGAEGPAVDGASRAIPEEGGPMTAGRLGELIRRIDANARQAGNVWEFALEELEVAVMYDTDADRMRIVIPIRHAEDLEPEDLTRLLQANFDTALDARYAIAQGILWATFIHPLSPLTDEQFLLGLGQTANIVSTYGTSYSSGLFTFGGGDSAELQRRELLERLKELGTTT